MRDGQRRGVCFIREYVPSRWVSWLARTLYNEPYRGVPFRSGAEFTWPMRNHLLYSAPFRSIQAPRCAGASFSTQLVGSVALVGRAARRRGSRRRDAAAGVGGAGPAG